MKITKSQITTLLEQGKKAAEIAEILGISVSKLREGCKQLNINLRAKPLNFIEFTDDTITNNEAVLETGIEEVETAEESVEEVEEKW